ncbi:hypothetical protein LBSP_21080 [Lentilactobacillus buchneri subsp. silagei]|uniref:phage tail tape measure protein n=1 Tax=Lentilactobacillus buchneri TaxID=1581 RepID=UPI0012E55080|nr:phage tail tape measure protein [Lentilactobacillus buchneri]GED95548.1 hypothetical protein LBSP_21080 [Lentilactobacillus buchneri subsp. silagei]
MGYARSAKVGFRVVSENMDAIDRANDKMDRLIRSSCEANNQLSHFGDRMSVQGLTKFEDKYDSLISKSTKLSDTVTNNVDKINNRLKGLADNSREYAGQIGKAFSDTSKEARNSFKRLPKEANFKVKTNLKQTSSDIDHANTRVQRFGTKGKTSFDNLSRSGRKTTKSFRNLYDAGNDFVNISSQIAMGAGMIGAAFLKSANEVTNLQNKYITIKNLLKTGGESSSQSRRETSLMQKENNRFALQYGVSPTAMAKGGEELVRRGYSGTQELASHKYFLQAARASGDPYNEVVNYGAPTLEQFGYKTRAGSSRSKMAGYTKKVLNEMAYGADLTATNFNGMGDALRYVGATAHSSNQGLARTVAGIGVLSNNGQDGSIAGTGLRKVMNSFAAPNMAAKSQQGQVMSALGLKPSDFQKANGQVKSLADNMGVLKKATAGMSSAEKFNIFHMFFGTTGQESGLILANNTKQLRSLTGQVSRAQQYGKNGYIQSLAKKNMQSWKNQIDVFKQYINIMGMGFTKTVLPSFTKALGVANKFLKVLIGLPAPIKKAAGYATAFAGIWGGIKIGKGLLGLSSSLLFGKGRRASAASGALSVAEDVAGASPLAGSRLHREGKVLTSRSESTHFAPSRLGNAATALSSDRLLRGMSYATIGLQIGGHAVSAFKKGIDSKQGGSQMWQAGGNAVGAGLGLALSGGNPLVAMIGSSVGGSVAKYIAGSKYIKNLAKGGNIDGSTRKESIPGETGAGLQGPEAQAANGLGYRQAMNARKNSNNKVHHRRVALGLDKYGDKELKSFTSSFNKANQNWATVSKGTGSKINQNVYGSLRKGLKSYTNSEKSSSDKRVQMLLKEGVISKKQAASMEKTDTKYWNSHYSKASKSISKVTQSERNGGKGREAAISSANRAVSKLLTNNANKETIIYGRLKDRTTRLSQSQARSIIRSSYKTMQSTVSSANKTYKSAKSAANKKYESVRNAADKEYYVTGSITKKQHDKIVKSARSQRDKTISAARTTKNKTIDNAETMHEKVVQKTSAMVKGNLKQMNTWTGKMKGIWSKFGDWWGNLWGGLTKIGHLGAKAMASNLTPELEKTNSFLGKLKSGKKSPRKSKRTASTDASRLPGNVFASHALGTRGAAMHAHNALVAEGGIEMAYKVNGRKARILGSNGPAIAKVKPGERILNHKDTMKVLSGSYGKNLLGYSTGNTKLGGKQAKSDIDGLSKKNSQVWSKVSKTTSKHTKGIKKQTVSDYDALQKGSYKQLVQFDKGNTSKWRNINSHTKHYTNQSKNQAISTYDSMQKGVQKQVNQMQSGVISSGKATATGFGHALGKMDNYAHSAMSNTVHQLNGGIKGIDKVLGQFGGNSSVINAIHYAKGSNGELSNDQLAIVNDAKSGPRQESIIRNNSLLIPHGNDRMIPLKKRDRVLNGSQTQELGRSMGIQHFAKGSGVSHSELRKIAKANSKDPSGFINKDFNVNVNVKGTDLQKGLTHTSRSASDKYATPWASAGWNVIEGLIKNSVDSNASMVKAMKRYGSGHKYVWGASGPSAFDCSGLVMYALKHAYGIDVPHNSGAQYEDTSVFKHISPSSAKPGDALFWGPGEHVGIYEGHGKYYSAFSDKPPKGHPDIGSYPVHGYGGNGQLLAAKIKGVPSGDTSKKYSKKNPLTALFKKEIGKSALKWIENNLQVSGGNFGGQMGGSSITKAMIRKAESVMKVPSSIRGKIMSDILKVAISETGNTNEMQKIHDINSANGNPAGGPLQFTKSTFMNYAVSGHKNWASPYDQVLAYLNNSQYKAASGETVIRGTRKFDWLNSGPHGSRRFANGGWSSVPAIFGEKKGEPEVAINPKRKTADGLIASAIDARSKVSNSVFSNESQKKMHRALLENLRKYNPLKNMPDKHQPTSGKGNNVTVNLNMNITVNANDKNAGTKVANDISRQVEEKVQAMFGKMMATREGGTA